MKSLIVNMDNALLVPNVYSVDVNGEDLRDVIRKNLPKELKNFEGYPANISITIDILDRTKAIVTEGYSLEAEPIEGIVQDEIKEGAAE